MPVRPFSPGTRHSLGGLLSRQLADGPQAPPQTTIAGLSSSEDAFQGFYEVLAQSVSSLTKAVYNPKAFFPHAAWLDQAFAHCPKFPTAASRRSLGRVSVPVWLVVLSDQLQIVALVGLYPTN